ncbi:hypothetical protein AXG93_4620s2210 [Marchantia polymorpha subsp. ruderalis]|uniref:Uncharacterized protein n=1 Tax=Marchantia polymorpha subsp. ruderalis TaxID=1480154 RepID=A0A176VZP6_MARPO|nr:hypothetical protein AXG93_4620s2210 [Marchantia polymorpha subsp. ruderalis]
MLHPKQLKRLKHLLSLGETDPRLLLAVIVCIAAIVCFVAKMIVDDIINILDVRNLVFYGVFQQVQPRFPRLTFLKHLRLGLHPDDPERKLVAITIAADRHSDAFLVLLQTL